MTPINKLILVHSLRTNDLNVLSASKADIPKKDKVYTLKKCFFHVGYRMQDCKYVMHFEELNHGNLVGYDAKHFNPVDEFGNLIPSDKAKIEISEEENPKWMFKENGRIIVPVEKK